MNFKRKLKLHSLNINTFSDIEIKYLNYINELNCNFTFNQKEFLFNIMNLKTIKLNIHPNYLFFIDDKLNLYFQINNVDNILVFNEKLLKKTMLIEMEEFIYKVTKKTYQIDAKSMTKTNFNEDNFKKDYKIEFC